MLAFKALGWPSGEMVFQDHHKFARTFQPDPAAHAVYQKAFQQFTWLNDLLQSARPSEKTIQP